MEVLKKDRMAVCSRLRKIVLDFLLVSVVYRKIPKLDGWFGE